MPREQLGQSVEVFLVTVRRNLLDFSENKRVLECLIHRDASAVADDLEGDGPAIVRAADMIDHELTRPIDRREDDVILVFAAVGSREHELPMATGFHVDDVSGN